MIKHLPVEPVLQYETKDEIVFPKTNSRMYIGTAGTKAFGRGDTISDLHISEIAFFDKAEEIFNGIIQSVPDSPDTEVNIESTANGIGNFYHNGYLAAKENRNGFKAFFFPWYFDG